MAPLTDLHVTEPNRQLGGKPPSFQHSGMAERREERSYCGSDEPRGGGCTLTLEAILLPHKPRRAKQIPGDDEHRRDYRPDNEPVDT